MWKYLVCFILIAHLAIASAKHKEKSSSSSSSSSSESESPKHRTAYICQDDFWDGKCPKGKLMRILKANFGRTDSERCIKHAVGNTTDVNCKNNNTKPIMREKCNNKRECKVCASSDVFGDECPDTSKYLKVVYECIEIDRCRKNEKFVVDMNICRETCNNPEGDVEECGCIPGCECTHGYVYDARSGRCVDRRKCPYNNPNHPNCTTHEHWTSCASMCERTCQDRHPVRPCPLVCVPGYVCDEGYIRDNETDRCIKEIDCPCSAIPPPGHESSESSSSDSDRGSHAGSGGRSGSGNRSGSGSSSGSGHGSGNGKDSDDTSSDSSSSDSSEESCEEEHEKPTTARSVSSTKPTNAPQTSSAKPNTGSHEITSQTEAPTTKPNTGSHEITSQPTESTTTTEASGPTGYGK